MGILGVTNDSQGQALQRLPVVIKVAIGLGPDKKAGRNHPQKLDHFIFQARSTDAESGWKVDDGITTAMADAHGKNPREIEIGFMDDELENVFRTNLAWWKATGWKCRGSLVQVEVEPAKYEMRAIRRTDKAPKGEDWPGNYVYDTGPKKGKPIEPCGDTCPDLQNKDCKPSGDLFFIPVKNPVLGAIWKLHTTSWNSIRNLHAALEQIRTLTGGRLAGIPLRLRVDPQAVSYGAGDEDKRKKSTAHILSINFRAEDLQKLIGEASHHALLFEQKRKYLGTGKIEIIDEDEEAEARSVAAEFHPERILEAEALPATGRGSMAAPRAVIPPMEEGPDRARISELCKKLGMNLAAEQTALGQFKGRLGELVAKLEAELKAKEPKNSPANTPGAGTAKTARAAAAPDQARPPAKSGAFDF